MNTQTSLSTLFARYETLCRYCDTFFETVYQAYHSEMHCAKGCPSCCILETVIPLEASVLASYLNTADQAVNTPEPPPADQTACVLLRQKICAVYPVRPVICRTHGLPLLYPEQQRIEVCPLNFTGIDLTTLDEHTLLNAESVTDNLLRLNLAFCTLTGQAERAGERIALEDILSGRYQPPVSLAFEKS